MRRSNVTAFRPTTAVALRLLLWSCALAMPSSPAVALPIASGSQCSSNWVNNEGALNCFIQGEEETRNGAKHPHYVACAGGDVFCCVDDDRGAQDCVAQARAKPANNADRLRAILAAHRTMLMRLGRYYSRPDGLPTKTPNSPRKAPP